MFFLWQIGGHNPADMGSSSLEQKFVANDKDVVEFKAGSQMYSLSFQGKQMMQCISQLSPLYYCYYYIFLFFFNFLSDMIQTNKRYGTKKVVRRRPKFVSAADAQMKRARYNNLQCTVLIPCVSLFIDFTAS